MATVNTIDTIEDLVRIMDERPEWVEAMRARLLTRELLELPRMVATFATEMNSFRATMDRFVAETSKFIASTNKRLDNIEARLDGHDARFDAVDARFDAVDARFDAADARFDAVDARFDAADARFDAVDANIQKMRNEMGPLKAAHARSVALRDSIAIARDMGLRRTKILTEEDIWYLIDTADTTDIPTNELRSFRLADLIMEATDQNGEICYIAVEISFTANGRDTTRAIRNAEYLTRLTGKRSYAAVAGLNRDNRIQESFESDKVFWHQLDPHQLEVE